MAASRKEDKYVDLGARYIFKPIAVETFNLLILKPIVISQGSAATPYAQFTPTTPMRLNCRVESRRRRSV